jgi:hypothetical protein
MRRVPSPTASVMSDIMRMIPLPNRTNRQATGGTAAEQFRANRAAAGGKAVARSDRLYRISGGPP